MNRIYSRALGLAYATGFTCLTACATPQDLSIDRFLADVAAPTNESAEQFLNEPERSAAKDWDYEENQETGKNIYGPKVVIDHRSPETLYVKTSTEAPLEGEIDSPSGTVFKNKKEGITLIVE